MRDGLILFLLQNTISKMPELRLPGIVEPFLPNIEDKFFKVSDTQNYTSSFIWK